MNKFLLLMAATFVAAGCSEKKSEPFSLPEDYRSWEKPVKRVLDYPVPGHGNSYRIIYANSVCYTAKETTGADGTIRVVMPEGSIIVKESYVKKKDINKKIRDITVMYKNSSDRDSIDGWVYYVTMPGRAAMSVGGRKCVGCHEAANEPHPYFDGNKKGIFRDYLFAPFVRQTEGH